MKRALATLLLGSGLGYGGLTLYQKLTPNKQLPSIESHVINHYVNEHNLKTSHKLTLMKAYMMLNKAFLDYGLVQRLSGFAFYQVLFFHIVEQIYFNRDEADTEKITEIYCIFSPKDEVCAHPSIQHGGVTATIIDQNTGLLAMLNTFDIVATSELKVKYLLPVRRGDVYLMKGWVQKRQGRKIFVKATIQDLQTKKKVAQGQALMMSVKWQHQMRDVFKFLFHKDNSGSTTQTPKPSIVSSQPLTQSKVV